MSFIAVKCPGCGYRFMVSPYAPPRITCGNCLTSIETGNTDHTGPLPAIPLAQATGFDGKTIAWLLLACGALLMVGAGVAIFALDSPQWSITLTIIGTVAVISAFLFVREQPLRTPEVSHEPTPGRGGTLSYQSPMKPRPRSAPSLPSIVLNVAIGLVIMFLIFLGLGLLVLGVCGAAWKGL